MILPPGLDCVRIMASTGRQGKRPCLWEGSPDVPQHEIEDAIDSDLRVRRWLTKERLIKGGIATLNMSLECFCQGRIVETIEVKNVSLFIRYAKKKQRAASDEVVIKSFTTLESTISKLTEQLEKNWKTMATQLEERETVIGQLVQRGLNPPPPPPPKQEAVPPASELETLIGTGMKLLQLANAAKSLRGSGNE